MENLKLMNNLENENYAYNKLLFFFNSLDLNKF